MIKIIIITCKNDITSDFIVKQLQVKKVEFYRLNTEDIGKTIDLSLDFSTKSYFLYDKIKCLSIDLLNIKSVYYRRPEIGLHINDLNDVERNFTIGEFVFTLEGIYKILYNSFWISSIDHIRIAENKVYQLLLAEKLGFTIPNSLITNQGPKAVMFYQDNNEQCIIKPIKSGLVLGRNEEAVIFTNNIKLDKDNYHQITSCPVYFQTQIDKKFDIRITTVGDQIFAASIDSQINDDSKTDWRRSKVILQHAKIQLPKNIENLCINLTKKLNLQFSAIDMIIDKQNNFFFLELNPNGQWAWIEMQLGFPISESITNLLIKHAV